MIYKIFIFLTKALLGVFDEELKEDDYDDVEEKKIVREAKKVG